MVPRPEKLYQEEKKKIIWLKKKYKSFSIQTFILQTALVHLQWNWLCLPCNIWRVHCTVIYLFHFSKHALLKLCRFNLTRTSKKDSQDRKKFTIYKKLSLYKDRLTFSSTPPAHELKQGEQHSSSAEAKGNFNTDYKEVGYQPLN